MQIYARLIVKPLESEDFKTRFQGAGGNAVGLAVSVGMAVRVGMAVGVAGMGVLLGMTVVVNGRAVVVNGKAVSVNGNGLVGYDAGVTVLPDTSVGRGAGVRVATLGTQSISPT